MDCTDLFHRANQASSLNPVEDPYEREQLHKKLRNELYFSHIESTLTWVFDKVLEQDIEGRVMAAATEGKRVCEVYRYRGYVGKDKVVSKEGVDLEVKALPVQFIALGPKQSPTNRYYGMRFFTANGVEPLVNRLQTALSPFKAIVECEGNTMVVSVRWPKPEPAPEPESEGDDFDISM